MNERPHLPQCANRVAGYLRFRCDQSQAIGDGLANQHAVKGIVMQNGQFRQLRGVIFRNRQTCNLMNFSLVNEKVFDRNPSCRYMEFFWPVLISISKGLMGLRKSWLSRSSSTFLAVMDKPAG